MNLTKLFEMQRDLDERIIKEKGLEQDQCMAWKVLALQVELGELANEWRGFKKWSNDQKPRTRVIEYGEEIVDGKLLPLETESNPLLEEYADCLSFILSHGNDLKTILNEPVESFNYYPIRFEPSMVDYFIFLIREADMFRKKERYVLMFCAFLGLGEALGFDMDMIEEAYFAKNKINHERQESGY